MPFSDNHHQPMMGATAANFQALATGNAIAYWEEGTLAKPPRNQIANPNPRPAPTTGARISAIRVVRIPNAPTSSEPGIAALHRYLFTLPYRP